MEKNGQHVISSNDIALVAEVMDRELFSWILAKASEGTGGPDQTRAMYARHIWGNSPETSVSFPFVAGLWYYLTTGQPVESEDGEEADGFAEFYESLRDEALKADV